MIFTHKTGLKYDAEQIGDLCVAKTDIGYELFHIAAGVSVGSITKRHYKKKELTDFARFIQDALPEHWAWIREYHRVFTNHDKNPFLVQIAVSIRQDMETAAALYWM